MIRKGAEPTILEGNSVGVLLLHGFTASPYEMKFLGSNLHEREGFTVSVPLLAGHGYGTNELNSVHWKDWISSSMEAYDALKSSCEKVFIVGMSMGGSIALHLASENKVDGLVCMGTPLYITKMSCLARLLYPFIKSVEKKGGPDIADEEQKKYLVSLETIPLHALIEFRQFLKLLKPKLKSVTSPLYLMHSLNDHTVEYENMDLIEKLVSSEILKKKTYTDSYHILPLDKECETVCKETLTFIKSLI